MCLAYFRVNVCQFTWFGACHKLIDITRTYSLQWWWCDAITYDVCPHCFFCSQEPVTIGVRHHAFSLTLFPWFIAGYTLIGLRIPSSSDDMNGAMSSRKRTLQVLWHAPDPSFVVQFLFRINCLKASRQPVACAGPSHHDWSMCSTWNISLRIEWGN